MLRLRAAASRLRDVFTATAQDAVKARRGDQIVMRMPGGEAKRAHQPRDRPVRAERQISAARIGAAYMRPVGAAGAGGLGFDSQLIKPDLLEAGADAIDALIAQPRNRSASRDEPLRIVRRNDRVA